jgi:hypothetical protein
MNLIMTIDDEDYCRWLLENVDRGQKKSLLLCGAGFLNHSPIERSSSAVKLH